MPKTNHQHPEAFCLMTYKDTAGNCEVIWNSRDGVTPFIVRSRAGLEAQHINWKNDFCAPNHQPKLGDRIFEDMTEESARKWRTEYVEKNWDHPAHPMHEVYPGSTKEEVVEMLVKSDMEEFDGHGPQLTDVTEEWLDKWAKAKPPADEALDILDALEAALPKNEFWTPQLCAAHKPAVEFLKTKGRRQ